MYFSFSPEHDDLRSAVRDFLADKSPEVEVRRLMDTTDGYDPGVWRQMAQQLGLQGLIVPEEFGGAGFGYVELLVVLEEMGRALLCAPYFSTVALAANLLLALEDKAAQADYLPGIADGSLIATVALSEASGRWDEAGITATAARAGDQWALTGEKMYVLDGHTAGLVLAAARTPGGVSLFAVDTAAMDTAAVDAGAANSGAAGVTATPLKVMDQTRKQARLTFEGAPARLVGTEGGAWPALSRMLDLAAVALAAEQVGGAQQVLDTAVAYAKERVQYGREIGSYQAIKHKLADLLVEVESAKSAAYYAAWAVAEDSDEVPAVASLAKSLCSEAYFHTAQDNIQVHGGIGFTWEHSAHLYFKRAKSSEVLFGDPSYHRELFAQRSGI
ncbi:MAG TPA: acyl-CoA dehydrogenase family protein [Trebonia sp.]|jgi:alkylation response protein AidB-like acyl-CoA dehydrogenase